MGQDVAQHHARPCGPQRAGRLDIVAGGKRGGLGIDDARDLDPVHHGDHHGDDPEAGLEDGGQRNGEQQGGKGHHQIGEAHQ